nr:ASCH domain-containing protein [uncultured Cupriavidus sp.]
MSLFQESFPRPGGRAVLLSIKPKYADLILSGTKRVEFRRSWAAEDVSMIVLYASSPVQRIVGFVEVEDVVIAPPSRLWKTCAEMGGGLTRQELRAYFDGKSQGVAVLLGRVISAVKHLNPTEVISNFVPPQSFRYLNAKEFMKLEHKVTGQKG